MNSWKLETQMAKLAAALFFTPPPQLHGKQSPFSADFAAKRMDFAASSMVKDWQLATNHRVANDALGSGTVIGGVNSFSRARILSISPYSTAC